MLASKFFVLSQEINLSICVLCRNFAVRQLEKAKVSIGQFGYKSMALNNSLINQVSPIDYGNNNNNNNSYLSANTNTVLNKCSPNALTVKNELLDLKLTHHHHHQQQQQSAPMPHGIANSVFVLKKPPMSAMSPSHTSLNPAAGAHSSKKFKTIINISNNSNRNNTHLQHTTTSIASSALTAANSIHNNINNNNNNNNSIANSIMNVIGAAHSSEQEYE